MSARRDWIESEAAITRLLPANGGVAARAQLLTCLAEYSAAAVREARELGGVQPSSADCDAALGWLLRPVFICGHQRSGTTLLQNLLDGHPQVLALPSEGTYFTSFAYVARAAPSEVAMDRFAAEWIARLVDPNFEPHFRLGKSDARRNPAVDFARALFAWHAALRSRLEPSLAPLLAVAAAFRTTTSPQSAPMIWVEKTPKNERHAPRFAPLDRARFIQLVRDPRATFASLAQIYRAAGTRFDPAEHARAIGLSLRLASSNARRLADRYLVVRYEDLIARPGEEIERVRRFLEIRPDPALLAPSAGGRPVRANSAFAAGDARDAGAIHGPGSPPALTADELALLGAHASGAAQTLGYDLPPARMRWALLARDWPRHALRRSRAALRAVVPAAATRR